MSDLNSLRSCYGRQFRLTDSAIANIYNSDETK